MASIITGFNYDVFISYRQKDNKYDGWVNESFAWEHEFKAFIELASMDQFGLKIKLPDSNVASRVLPVRIHHLDIADSMAGKSSGKRIL